MAAAQHSRVVSFSVTELDVQLMAAKLANYKSNFNKKLSGQNVHCDVTLSKFQGSTGQCSQVSNGGKPMVV